MEGALRAGASGETVNISEQATLSVALLAAKHEKITPGKLGCICCCSWTRLLHMGHSKPRATATSPRQWVLFHSWMEE